MVASDEKANIMYACISLRRYILMLVLKFKVLYWSFMVGQCPLVDCVLAIACRCKGMVVEILVWISTSLYCSPVNLLCCCPFVTLFTLSLFIPYIIPPSVFFW